MVDFYQSDISLCLQTNYVLIYYIKKQNIDTWKYTYICVDW